MAHLVSDHFLQVGRGNARAHRAVVVSAGAHGARRALDAPIARGHRLGPHGGCFGAGRLNGCVGHRAAGGLLSCFHLFPRGDLAALHPGLPRRTQQQSRRDGQRGQDRGHGEGGGVAKVIR